MKENYFPIVIIGHVDHGKSTLIGKLLLETNSLPKDKFVEVNKVSRELGKDSALAFLTDQLKEEREQEKTIDTTQIFLKTRKRGYVIIDVPGHVEFIKNMLTGASYAKAAILIIDISVGIQEQTKRHLHLISLLGINNVLVAFNKIDLLNDREKKDAFEKIKIELLSFMSELKITPSHIIPVSARDNINILKKNTAPRWYKGPSLLTALDSLKPKIQPVKEPLRFPIQDIYEIGGEKIIVGTVLSSIIKQNQAIRLFPSLKDTTIKSIKVFPRNIHKACAGESIGLTLNNPSLARKGELIALKTQPPRITNHFQGDIFWLVREPLKINTPLTLECLNQKVSCLINKISKRIDSSTLKIIEENAIALELNELGMVLLQTESLVAIEEFGFIEELGRFILRKDDTPQGIGIITQVFPPK